MRQHEDAQVGFSVKLANVDLGLSGVGAASFKEELRSFQHSLVDSELEPPKRKIFKYSIEKLNGKIMDEKLDHFLNNLKCARKVKLLFEFFLRDTEDGIFRNFVAHGNNTLLDRSKLLCTKDNLTKQKHFLNETDVHESCCRETLNTKWKF